MWSYTRRELYEKIWSIPVQRLAEKHGLSDKGLANICKRHNIPRPPRGYWMKNANARKKIMQKNRLPKGDPKIHIEFGMLRKPRVRQKLEELFGIKDIKSSIELSKNLEDSHPLVSKTKTILENVEPDWKGMLITNQGLDIRVYKHSLERALLIMDTLIKYFGSNGFFVSLSNQKTRVLIKNRTVAFGLMEKLRREFRHPKNHDLNGFYNFGFDGIYKFGYKEYDYVPSGELQLQINETHKFLSPAQSIWKDTEKRRLEDILHNFVKGVLKVAARKAKEPYSLEG